MDKEKIKTQIEVLTEALGKINDKSFNVYFYVMDTKGNPSSTLKYIYQTADTLKDLGYNVTMLHNEKEFVGVEEWLGEKYASLPHKNIEKENVSISASDFLFIPEVYENVMSQTKKLPCKRIAMLTNYDYLVDITPVGVTWGLLGIDDAVTTTETLKSRVGKFFPTADINVVRPYISSMFRPNPKPKDLVINIVSKNPEDVHKIMKPFYWKYPIYKWVSFVDLRGYPQEVYSEALRAGAITIWVNDNTDFGTSVLEALKCGCVTLAKVPDTVTDWMVDPNTKELTDSVLWFDDFDRLPDMLASVVRAWLTDNLPEDLSDCSSPLCGEYTKEEHIQDVKNVYVGKIFAEREAEIKEAIATFKAQLNND